jgi:hypothetical protein
MSMLLQAAFPFIFWMHTSKGKAQAEISTSRSSINVFLLLLKRMMAVTSFWLIPVHAGLLSLQNTEQRNNPSLEPVHLFPHQHLNSIYSINCSIPLISLFLMEAAIIKYHQSFPVMMQERLQAVMMIMTTGKRLESGQ